MSRSKAQFKATFGSPSMVAKMVTSDEPADRAEVAKKQPEHHAHLADDPSSYVREQVAFHTKDKSILDKLSDDHDHDVTAAVISHGHEDHLDKHVSHTSSRIRVDVAKRGKAHHLDQLVHDRIPDVREEVARSGDHSHRDKLMYDPERYVRQVVAAYGNDSHHQVMMKDPSWAVRRRVATHSTNRNILQHLHDHDEDTSVRDAAFQSLHKLSRT